MAVQLSSGLLTRADPALNHTIVHQDVHASRVRIVPQEEAAVAVGTFQLLFPHEAVHTSPIGRAHVCIYTDTAPASLVAERISEHLREVERLPV